MTVEERLDSLEREIVCVHYAARYLSSAFAIFFERRGFAPNECALIMRMFKNNLGNTDEDIDEEYKTRTQELLEEYAESIEQGPDWTPTIIEGGKK